MRRDPGPSHRPFTQFPSVTVLLSLFGFAVLCMLGALTAFAIEALIADKSLRSEGARSDRRARR